MGEKANLESRENRLLQKRRMKEDWKSLRRESEREIDRERETDRQTDRQRQRDRDTNRGQKRKWHMTFEQ